MGKSIKNASLISCCIVAMFLLSSVATASSIGPSIIEKDDKTIRLSYTFGIPNIEDVMLDAFYDRVTLDHCSDYGDTGEPVLPVKPVNVLLPYGRDVQEIIVVVSEPVYLGEGYFVEPRPVPQPIGDVSDEPIVKSKTYESTDFYPGATYEVVGTHYQRGYPIMTLNLFPVQYIPKYGEIYYYEKMELIVVTTEGTVNSLLRNVDKDRELVTPLVDNPATALTYPQPRPHHSYDYVIITCDALNSTAGPYNWQALLDSKIAKGLGAKKVTVEWINSAFTGVDLQDKIRNFIRYAYSNWDTEYVLLGGDADQSGSLEYSNTVPARYLFCSPDDGDPTDSYAEEFPSDVYYSNLDGSFDGDADGIYGEPTDGDGGGDVDLRAEVFVGRAPADNAAEISNFVRKTLAYETTTDPYLNKVLLFAEYLGFGGVAEYASGNLDMLVNGSANHGYDTAGFPAESPADDRYAVEKLYDEYLGGDNAVTGAMVVNRMNAGVNVIVHDGHGSEDWVLEMSQSHYSYYGEPNNYANMTNTKYFFAYSIACDPGAFDNNGPVHGFLDDSIAEDFVLGTYGAFAVVMNVRYGWGYGYSTDGPGTTFERQFVDAIYGEGYRTLGRANADSKEDNIWRLNQDCMRWTYYSENLIGDPEVEIRPPESNTYDAGVRDMNRPGPLTGTGINVINATIMNYGTSTLSNLLVNCSVYSLNMDVLFFDDMESGSGAWTVVDNGGTGSWTIVEPTDPTRLSSATHAFKCTPGATYSASSNDSLISPVIDCSGLSEATAEFYIWYKGQYSSGYKDYGSVYLSDDNGVTWTLVTTNLCYVNYAANLAGVRYSFPIEKYVDLTSQVKIKFKWVSDSATQAEGMYVDDVFIYSYDVLSRIFAQNATISSLGRMVMDDIEFNWNATTAGWYAVNVTTKLGTDQYALNDYWNLTTYVMANNDVGVETITYPVGLYATGTYGVQATVRNYGYGYQSNVPVNCTIRDSTNAVVFTNETLVNLDSLERGYLTFASWTVSVEGVYTINVTTNLTGDEGPYNDYKEETVNITDLTDIEVKSINKPTAGSQLGGGKLMNVTVMNNGTVIPTFNLTCIVTNATLVEVYNETLSNLTLNPWQVTYYNFPAWEAVVEGTYNMVVTAVLATDEDPSDNVKNITVIIDNIDDVGCINIIIPDIAPMGTQYIDALFRNFGNVNKTNVPANCTIYYNTPPGTVFLTENFNGYVPASATVPPAGWTEQIVSGGTGTAPDWSGVSSGTSPTCSPYNGGFMAKFNSYSCSATRSARMYTYAMDLSSVGSPQVVFYMYHDTGYTTKNDRIVVQYSLNGVSWTDVTTIKRYTGTSGWRQEIVAIPGLANQPTAYVGFLGISDYGNNIYIDYATLPDGTTTSFEVSASGWPPAGWTLVRNSGNYDWIPSSSSSYRPPLPSSGYYALAQDPTGTSPPLGHNINASLFTPSIDLTGITAASVELDHYFDNWYTVGYLDYAEIRVWSGGVYEETIARYEDALYKTHSVVSFSPVGYTDPSDVKIEFLYTINNMRGDWWSIDNVVVRDGGQVFVFGQDISISRINRSSANTHAYFGPWTPAIEGNYTIIVKTNMTGDEVPANDAYTKQIWMHDINEVKVTSVNYPIHRAVYGVGISHTVNATVQNTGNTMQANMTVNCSVYDSTSATLAVNEGFEGASIPVTWANIDGDGDGYKWVIYSGSSYAHSGTYSVRTQRSPLGNDDYLIPPQISVPSGGMAALTFWAKSSSSYHYENMTVKLSTTGTNKADFTVTLDKVKYVPTTYTKYAYDLSPWAGQSVYVAIVCTSEPYGYTTYYQYVDDVQLETFTGPSLVYFSELTTNVTAGSSVKMDFTPAWTPSSEGDYIVKVTAYPAKDTIVYNNVSLNHVIINNIDDVGATSINYPPALLAPGSYAVNATIHNFGNYNLTSTFDVNCSIYELVGGGTLLSEGFEGATFPPAGWTNYNTDPPNAAWELSTSYYHSGTHSVRGDPGTPGTTITDEWLITPAIYINDVTQMLSFWYRSESSSYKMSFDVRLSTTTTDKSAFTTTLFTRDNFTSTTYLQQNVSLASYYGDTVYIAFHLYWGQSYIWYMFLDDISVWAPPIYQLVGTDTKAVVGGVPLGTDVYVNFDPILMSNEGYYSINVTTLLATDENNANNATKTVVRVQNIPDVGVLSVNYPANKIIKLTENFNNLPFPPTGWFIQPYSVIFPLGTWEREYATNDTYKPSNAEGYYAEADSDDHKDQYFDVGLFTPPIDLTGVNDAYAEFDRFFYNLVTAEDYAAVNVYSGGRGPGNFEEQLLLLTTDDPSTGVHTLLQFDPSGYADPAQVYIEFYYNNYGNVNAWKFAIDNLVVFTPGVYVAGNYTVNATVYNYGTMTETFDVRCNITALYAAEYVALFSDDMESGTNGWTTLATAGTDLWHQSSRRYISPSTAWYCGKEASGVYDNSTTNFLISPALDMSGAPSAILTYDTWYSLENNYDKGYVCASPDNNTFTILKTYTGLYNAWISDSVDISSCINASTGLVNVAFVFTSDSSVVKEGWYVDNVCIQKQVSGATSELVYTATTTVTNLSMYEQRYVEFTPPWEAVCPTDYLIEVETLLPYDINHANDMASNTVTISHVHLPTPGTFTLDHADCCQTWVTLTTTNATNVYIKEMAPLGNEPCTPVFNVNITIWPEENVVWPVYIQIFYTQEDLDARGVTEEELIGIFYYDGTNWILYNHTGVNTNDVWVNHIPYAGYGWAYAWADQMSPKMLGAGNKAPLSNITVTLDPDGYFIPASRFTISATDDLTGWKIYYRIDGGAIIETEWNTPALFQINALNGYSPGPHTVEYWAVDEWGFEETHHKKTYVLDETGPTVDINFEGIAELTTSGRHQITPLTRIVFTAEDDQVSVQKIRYRLDSEGDWLDYVGPLTLSEGLHLVSVIASDTLGNIGSATYTIQVGGGEPTTALSLSPEAPTGDNGWYVTAPVIVTLSASDEASGVAHTLYRIDGGAWQTYTVPFEVGEGIHTVEYYSVDNAGLNEQVQHRTVSVDLYGPEITLEHPRKSWVYVFDRAVMPRPGNREPLIIGGITITAKVQDTMTSGLSTTKLFVDGVLRSEGTTETVSYVLDERIFGEHMITIEASDVAGNTVQKEFWIRVFNLNLRA